MKVNPAAVAAAKALAEHEATSYPGDTDRTGQLNWIRKKNHLEKLARSFAPMFEVGDGITELLYSDAHAYTVIGVSGNGKRITVQRDKAILDPTFKPNVLPGGFAGHTTNNSEQSYSYEADSEGSMKVLSLRTEKLNPTFNDGIESRTLWVTVGTATKSVRGKQWIPGRHEHYDYNF